MLTFGTKSGFSRHNMSSCSLSPRGPATLCIYTYTHTYIHTLYIYTHTHLHTSLLLARNQGLASSICLHAHSVPEARQLYVYVHTYIHIYSHVCIYRNMLTFGTKPGYSKYNMSSCSLSPRGSATFTYMYIHIYIHMYVYTEICLLLARNQGSANTICLHAHSIPEVRLLYVLPLVSLEWVYILELYVCMYVYMYVCICRITYCLLYVWNGSISWSCVHVYVYVYMYVCICRITYCLLYVWNGSISWSCMHVCMYLSMHAFV